MIRLPKHQAGAALTKGGPSQLGAQPQNTARHFSRRKQPERALHKAVAAFLDRALPDQTYWFPIPNASKRGKIQAANMKRAGEMKPGVPDLCILNRGKCIFVELKAGKNGTTAIQDAVHRKITLAGSLVAVIRSVKHLDEFLSCIMQLKAHVQ